MSRLALTRWIVALLVTAAPAAAQEPGAPGAAAFRTGLGAVLLMPVAEASTAPFPDGRWPSGRITLTRQIGGGLGLHAGAVRIVDDRARVVSGTWAGVAGLRYNVLRGSVRLAPFVEVGAGRAQAAVDDDGYEYVDDGGELRYRPVWSHVDGTVYGGGGGATGELIVGPGLTLELTAGYWHFLPPERLDEPLGGAFAGAGLRWSFRDDAWYWRTSGRDHDAPVIAVIAPEPDSSGVYALATDTATVTVLVSDASDIDGFEADGAPIPVSAVHDTLRDRLRLRRAARIAYIPLRVAPGSTTVRLAARDGAGNTATHDLVVTGPPVDRSPPRIAVLRPHAGAQVTRDTFAVTGMIADGSALDSVTVNGTHATIEATSAEDERRAAYAEEDERAYRFHALVTLDVGANAIEIVAVDSMGNAAELEHRVYRRPPAVAAGAAGGPEIEILEPRQWRTGTRGIEVAPKRSIAIEGIARHARGVAEVRIDGARASLAVDASGAVRFTGHAPVDDGTNTVEIIARGRDGRATVRTFPVRPTGAAGGGEAAEAGLGEFGGERWAVVIGVSDYRDPAVPDLEYADDDARAVYDFLRSEAAGLGGIPEENIRLLINEQATARNIRSALFTFLNHSTDDDVLFIYIAGHGMPDPDRLSDFYLLGHDAELDDLAATAVPMGDVGEAVQRAYAYNKILITDACHAAGVGAAGRRAGAVNPVNRLFLDAMHSASGGYVAFTASETNQLSQEGAEWGGGHGVFTHFLLEGLQGAADTDGDRIVTLGETMEYTREQVRRATANAQIPAISLTAYDRYWPMAIAGTP